MLQVLVRTVQPHHTLHLFGGKDGAVIRGDGNEIGQFYLLDFFSTFA
jgi:hypothetical protein